MIPCKYDGTDFFNEGVASVKDNGKWGAIDKQGREIIPFVYESQFNFSEGLAAVERNGQFGYIDKQGNVVIDFSYGAAERFMDGIAKVYTKVGYEDGSYSMEPFNIDKNGRETYKSVTRIKEGLMIVRPRYGKCGIIDKNFNEIVPCIYDEIDSRDSDGLLYAKKDGKYGFIDMQGKSTFDYYGNNPDAERNMAIHEKEALIKGIVDYLNERSNYGSIVTNSDVMMVTKAQNGLWQASVTLAKGDDLYFYDINDIAFNSQMGKVYSARIVQIGFEPDGAVDKNYGYDVVFRNSDDVWAYIRSHKFKANTGTVLEIRGTTMYFNGTAVANGLIVKKEAGNTAGLESANAHMWVNGPSHYIQNLIDGTIYREVK